MDPQLSSPIECVLSFGRAEGIGDLLPTRRDGKVLSWQSQPAWAALSRTESKVLRKEDRTMFSPCSFSWTALRAAARGPRLNQNCSSTVSSICKHKRHFRNTAFRRGEEKPERSFRGQLYESTQQRVERERAEIDRFTEMQRESPTLKYTALTVCK